MRVACSSGVPFITVGLARGRSRLMPHPGAIVTGRGDLQSNQPSEKHKWWETADATYPVQADFDANASFGADDAGDVKLVGFPVQNKWSGSWREFMAERARPKPNTMSSLHYTMHQTEDAYIFVRTQICRQTLGPCSFHLNVRPRIDVSNLAYRMWQRTGR